MTALMATIQVILAGQLRTTIHDTFDYPLVLQFNDKKNYDEAEWVGVPVLPNRRQDEHDRFVESVISGKDNMPSWYGVLKADEIEAIWSYIRATVDK